MTSRPSLAAVPERRVLVWIAVFVGVAMALGGVVLVRPSPVDADTASRIPACLASLQTVAAVYDVEQVSAGGSSECTYRDEDGWELLRLTVGEASPERREQITRDALLVPVDAVHRMELGSVGDAAVIRLPDRAEFVVGDVHVWMQFTRGATAEGILTTLEETADAASVHLNQARQFEEQERD